MLVPYGAQEAAQWLKSTYLETKMAEAIKIQCLKL